MCFPIKEAGACSPEGGDWRDSPTWKQVLRAEVRYVRDEKVILARIGTLAFTLSPSPLLSSGKISATGIILTGILSHEVDSKRMQYLYLLLKTPHWMVMTVMI